VEMREILAGRHEQGDRQQRAEVGLEAGATHGGCRADYPVASGPATER
jgi:hypothetical protein